MTWAGFIELCGSLLPFASLAVGYWLGVTAANHRIEQREIARREFRFAIARPIDAETIDAAVRGDL